MTAALLAAIPQAEKDEEFYASLSVETYDIPEHILRSADSFSLQGEYTSSESDGPLSLQGRLEDELNSNGIDFIAVGIRRLGPNNGTLQLTFSELPEGVHSRTVGLRSGGSVHTIVQTRPQRLGYELTPPGQKYPGDEQTITVTGGIVGVKYFLCYDGRLLTGTETVCDGSPMTFGPYMDTGVYMLYNEETGHTANSVQISDYDIFMPDGGGSTDEDPMTMPLILPSQGGTVSIELDSYKTLDRETYGLIEHRMNSEGVRWHWTPDGHIYILLDVKDAHTLEVSFLCAPNFSSEPRTNDTGFYVDDPGRTLTVMQPGDPDGNLAQYVLSGEWIDKDAGTFSLTTSGSQFGVAYTLTRNGCAARTLTGTGKGLSFGTFSGIDSFGEYRILGEYGGKTMQSNTVTMRRSDIPDGNNYVLRKTYQDACGDSTVADVTYYDGLGYPEQTIAQHGGGRGGNLVTPIVYDRMRRGDARTYLPYVSGTDDIRRSENAVAKQSEWYGMTDAHPYMDRTYESGPSGRLLSVMREGAVYRKRGVRTQLSYSVEDGSGGILRLEYEYPRASGGAGAIRNVGTWPAESLDVTRCISEDNDTSYVYSNGFGKTIMTREADNGKKQDTYYVYDLKDSLVCVIQPGGVESIRDGFSFNDGIANGFCFTWRYDAWGNVIESHVPAEEPSRLYMTRGIAPCLLPTAG